MLESGRAGNRISGGYAILYNLSVFLESRCLLHTGIQLLSHPNRRSSLLEQVLGRFRFSQFVLSFGHHSKNGVYGHGAYKTFIGNIQT